MLQENLNKAELAALVNRLTLGVMFLAHGLLKLLVFTPAGTAGFFESVGFPGFFAYLVILAEVGGGVALISGIATRLVSVALLPVLLGALVVHAGNGWLFSAPNGGWEFPAFLIMSTIVQIILGSGAYAIRLPFLANVKFAQ
ncbi:DoxX family protein [Curvivirga sp.]|uniref:DoxX family protein n=1 Tax=Curvivirga sp. TaxID=2856848 RepID=UPI003B5C3C33